MEIHFALRSFSWATFLSSFATFLENSFSITWSPVRCLTSFGSLSFLRRV